MELRIQRKSDVMKDNFARQFFMFENNRRYLCHFEYHQKRGGLRILSWIVGNNVSSKAVLSQKD